MQEFRNLAIWHKSRELAVMVYRFSAAFPRSELFGLTAQIRRAAVSVVLNIAEGCGKSSRLDFARFLEIAISSANEVEAALVLSEDLQFVPAGSSSPVIEKSVEVKKMTCGLLRRINPL
jgi:four helix bundle protein